MSEEKPSIEPDVSESLKMKRTGKKKNAAKETPFVENAALSPEEPVTQAVLAGEAVFQVLNEKEIAPLKLDRKNRPWLIGALISGVIVGFLLCYFLIAVPVQNQLANVAQENSNGNSSNNIMKSDLSTTKLKQQEMEIRYDAVSGQLESANQYIFLLRMKEQLSFARLLVEQKDGMTARQTLSEIQSRFDHLKPFVIQKDPAAAEKIDELIKQAIHHLISDPEAVKSDLAEINSQLEKIETTLFQPD